MLRPMEALHLLVLFGVPTLVLTAGFGRGRLFAIFAGVMVGLQSAIGLAIAPSLPLPWPLQIAFQISVFAHFGGLVRPRMRGRLWRFGVSLPALTWTAGCLLAGPWALAATVNWQAPAPWLPFALGLVGLAQSVRAPRSLVDLALDGAPGPVEVTRHPLGHARVARPLRLVQITDPHLGPFMSEERLAAICARAVDAIPDLVLLTGDFLTMASADEPDRVDGAACTSLGRALAPLRPLAGRTFACLGNHDHEAPDHVRRGLAEAGVTLLVDEATMVDTAAGRVQVVGFDYRLRKRQAHLEAATARTPRQDGALRLVLLHDPGAFRHLPPGSADLVLSGHTHGGQLGLVSLGLNWTVAGGIGKVPDHGFFARGPDRLYVHRGTGHYGFPLRIGVPAEESVVQVHVVGAGIAFRGIAFRGIAFRGTAFGGTA